MTFSRFGILVNESVSGSIRPSQLRPLQSRVPSTSRRDINYSEKNEAEIEPTVTYGNTERKMLAVHLKKSYSNHPID